MSTSGVIGDLKRDILYYSRIGDVSEVEKCLNEGINVDFQNGEGETALQISAANGISDLVNLLLLKGASVDLPNNYGWTPLMHSSRHGHYRVSEILLKMKAKVNICNKIGLSPVVAAAWNGDLKTLKLLIDAGAIVDQLPPLAQHNESDLTSLMAAALQGHEDMVNFLLEKRVYVDQSSPVTGLSPLMLASCSGHKKIVELLVDHESNMNQTDICNKSCLEFAKFCNKEDIVLYLENVSHSRCESGSGSSNDIFKAVKSGDLTKVKEALKGNSSCANLVNPDDGLTPLMLAAKLGVKNIIPTLLSYGAKIDTQSSEDGWTALMFAVFYRRTDIVELLLKKGAVVDLVATNGHTALDLARHLDGSDTAIIENLTSKVITNDPIRDSFAKTPTNSIDKRKSTGQERFFPKKSDTQTGLKSWIGGVAQQFQQKMMTRLSSRHSDRLSAAGDTLVVEETVDNEVFLDDKATTDDSEADGVCSSHRLSPNQYLAKELKEHDMKALTPPLPPLTYYIPPSISSFKSASGEKTGKLKRNHLRVPNLLRSHTRKILQNMDTVVVQCNTTCLNKSVAQDSNFSDMIETDCSKQLEDLNQACKVDASDGELTAVLNRKSLQKYLEIFRQQELDIETVKHLTKEDLVEIGIENTESQRKLLDVIKQLQNLK